MILKLKRTPGIYLVGFMGCGKSTVGRMLAQELGWPFADLDHEIEAAQKRSIADIFVAEGEETFRQIETEALKKRVRGVQAGRPLVLAVGGGTFAQPANRSLMNNNGISIWLDCSLEVARRRVEDSTHRPLARDPEKFEALFHARRTAYGEADYRIEISRDDSAAALRQVLALPLF